MAYTAKTLAFGYVASSKTTIYTAPSSTTSVIHNILLHNTNTSSETLELFLNDGTERRIYRLTVAANDTIQIDFIGEGIVLDTTDLISGNTTTADKVTIVVVGTEVTA
jgi:hypothetical protein